MKHEDIVDQASKALRDTYAGETENAALARQRILASVSRRSSKRRFRWFFGTPLLALIVGGTAWAAQTGQLAAVWHTVTTALSPGSPELSGAVHATTHPESSRSPARTPSKADPTPHVSAASEEATPSPADGASASDMPTSAAAQSTPLAQATSVTSAEPVPTGMHARASRPRVGGVAVSGGPSTALTAAEQQPPAPAPAPDLELSLFRQAHQLHFSGNAPDSAVAAYRGYIKQFPSGRFVPEARYNLALNYIKLGNKTLARQELQPFAEGSFGGYRQAEARQLLEALR